MISILRRLSKPFLCTTRVSKLMDSSADSSGCSRRLVALAQQLRLYKPPPLLDDIEEPSSEESNGKVVSQVGFPESTTPIPRDPERFRPKRAAVLICLFEGNDGDLRVILTKRSSRLSTHSGEVALPGGKAEEGDEDDGATATREAKEEIGLDPSLVNVVTVLEPFLSKHLLRVVPVIGIMNERNAFNPRPNPAEVDEVFDAPLDMFLKDENRRSEEREWMGCKYLVHFFDYETENKKFVIWGLTAGILIRAASIVLQSSPPFLEQNPIFKVEDSKDYCTHLEPKIKFQSRGSHQYHVLRKISLRVNARNKLAAVAGITSSMVYLSLPFLLYAWCRTLHNFKASDIENAEHDSQHGELKQLSVNRAGKCTWVQNSFVLLDDNITYHRLWFQSSIVMLTKVANLISSKDKLL